MSDTEAIDERGLSVIDVEHELRLGDQHVASYRDVLNRAAEVSADLSRIIRERKLSKRIGPKEFVFVEGWTTCGAMLGVAIRPVSCDENPNCEGEFVATVEAVRASDGFVLGRGIASCGPDEREWQNRSRQARRSMAQTRAAGKAMRLLFSWIIEMAGFAATPFEEMEGCQAEQHDNPAPNPHAPTEQPRDKRQQPPPDNKPRCADLLARWRSRNPQSDGDVEQWNLAYARWVREVTKRNFKPFMSSAWTDSDFTAVERALSDMGA